MGYSKEKIRQEFAFYSKGEADEVKEAAKACSVSVPKYIRNSVLMNMNGELPRISERKRESLKKALSDAFEANKKYTDEARIIIGLMAEFGFMELHDSSNEKLNFNIK